MVSSWAAFRVLSEPPDPIGQGVIGQFGVLWVVKVHSPIPQILTLGAICHPVAPSPLIAENMGVRLVMAQIVDGVVALCAVGLQTEEIERTPMSFLLANE